MAGTEARCLVTGRKASAAGDPALGEGGVLCVACSARGSDTVGLSAPGLELVRRILGGDLSGALGTPESPATLEVERLATRALEHHLERRMRSLPVAGALEG